MEETVCNCLWSPPGLLVEVRRLECCLEEGQYGAAEEKQKRALLQLQRCILKLREAGDEKLSISSQLLDTVSTVGGKHDLPTLHATIVLLCAGGGLHPTAGSEIESAGQSTFFLWWPSPPPSLLKCQCALYCERREHKHRYAIQMCYPGLLHCSCLLCQRHTRQRVVEFAVGECYCWWVVLV